MIGNYTFNRGDELFMNSAFPCSRLGGRRRTCNCNTVGGGLQDTFQCDVCPFPREEGRFSFLCQMRRLINRRIILNVRDEVLDVLLLDVGCDSIRVLDTTTDTIRIIRADRILSFDEPQYMA